MRRKDREITDTALILDIINDCKVFRLALSIEDRPYIVPLNFGYDYTDNAFAFYFHCADAGQKLDMIGRNPHVCFEMDCGHALTVAEVACGYSYQYRSVVGRGKASVVQNVEEKKRMLSSLMHHQTGKHFDFTDEQMQHVTVCKIEVKELTAKAQSE